MSRKTPQCLFLRHGQKGHSKVATLHFVSNTQAHNLLCAVTNRHPYAQTHTHAKVPVGVWPIEFQPSLCLQAPGRRNEQCRFYCCPHLHQCMCVEVCARTQAPGLANSIACVMHELVSNVFQTMSDNGASRQLSKTFVSSQETVSATWAEVPSLISDDVHRMKAVSN